MSFGYLGVLVAFVLTGNINPEGKVKVLEWSPHSKIECRLNMGPTGAAAWMRNENYHIMKVDKGSPADGILQVGDLVIGVNGKDFSADVDSRMTLGNEIGKSEAKDGKLALKIRRNGKDMNVTVNLPVTGPYSKTWPYNCKKSQEILDKACFRILELQSPSGEIITDGAFGTFQGGLLLLASGESRFMDGARRAVYINTGERLIGLSYHNWALGYGGMLLAEYYLATGDKTVLPEIKIVVDKLASGQMYCGSWGHNGPSGGYGALNQPGVTCAIAMILAKECGIKVDEKALKKAVEFYCKFAELGAVPYGDHRPNPRTPDDNGKNSTSAIMCKLHPDFQKEAATFAKTTAISYWLREEGHTGGLFSMVWGPIAASMTDSESFRKFMDYQKWYYNLSRAWNGNLLMLPYFEALQRFDSCTYIGTNGKFTTGGMGLVYALPHKKIRVLGAPKSIFGAKIKNKALLKARDAYQNRDWKAYDEAFKEIQNDSGITEEDRRWVQQLIDAKTMLDATAKDTITEINNNIEEGDAYFAEKQYIALKRFLGDKDERILALDKKFEDGNVKWHIKEGTRYYEGLEKLETMSFISWVPYGNKVRNSMEGMKSIKPLFWKKLIPVEEKAEEKAEENKEKPKSGEISISRSFKLEDTDYTSIRLRLRAPRKCHVKVKLNGVKVANIVRGQRGGYAKLPLDNSVLALLKQGKNSVEVSSTSMGSGNNKLDFGLDAVPTNKPYGITPAWSSDIKVTGPEVPETLTKVLNQARNNFTKQKLNRPPTSSFPEPYRVRESKEKFIIALNAACDDLSKKELINALSSPIPYWRYLASQALARKGEEGIKSAKEGLKNKDWRVRSSSCDILTALYQPAKTGEKKAELPSPAKTGILTQVTDLLKDENPWVRCRAAETLGVIGKNNIDVAKSLADTAGDPDEWVRYGVLTAMTKIAEDKELMKKAGVAALKVRGTGFGPINRSYGLIEKSGFRDQAVLNALLFVIEHPAEGGGAHCMNKILNLLVEVDKEGNKAIPVLINIAKGHYDFDRMRGNPRETSIVLLGKYGPKAKAATEILTKITEEKEDKKTMKYKEVAQVALDQINKK